LVIFLGLAASVSTPAAPAHRPAASVKAPALFEKYCFECHGETKPKGGVNLEQLLRQPTLGPHADAWEKVAEQLDTGEMPPKKASQFPTATERASAAEWIRTSLSAYALQHAGEPGRVTVRRLTSGEYGYAIRELTGIDIEVGIDESSDSVGGEGFTNFGDVQFVQDAGVERYLEAAKRVADHAVIGAGPLQFYSDPGKSGLELSALNRINTLHSRRGFRVVSGEGGRPFGLERYGQAFFVAWRYQHRAALGEARVKLNDLATREGITGRFAEHVWSVVTDRSHGYPTSEMVARWKALPAPTADVPASIARAQTGCDALSKVLTTWPSWFFARGDLAAGGAGDESPLVFTDSSLKAEPVAHIDYLMGPRRRRTRDPVDAPPAGPTRIFISFTNVNPTPGVMPVVIWRDPRVVTRTLILRERDTNAVVTTARRRGPPGPLLASEPLRTVLPPEVAARLSFGKSPDGTPMGPNDFAITGPVAFELPPRWATNITAELEVDAELGADRNAVVRVTVRDHLEGTPRPPSREGTNTPSREVITRVLLGDPASTGYRAFRAGMTEYVRLLPPNSHGEANPADKDPVPPPFDNTYNTPEHDAFVLKVKYQRTDAFLTDNLVDGAERAQLNHAWHDLFGSWPYHNGYLDVLAEHYEHDLRGLRITDMSPVQIAALPAEMRPHVASLRAHYDEVQRALARAQPGHVEDALNFASRAWRRPLTAAEKSHLKAFYHRCRKEDALDHDDAIRALLARILVSPAFLYRVETVASRTEQALNSWELASRLSFFLWSSIPDEELRRAAAANELGKPTELARQVKRMTADPKARRVATEFFGQWLGFYRFDQFRGVDTGRFPEFTEEVQAAMYDEAVSTFEFLIRQERPVKELLRADYTFLNQPLAKFYGIEKAVKSTNAVERVDGANSFDRGGALRLGAVLTTTSAPLRTSPVKRGDWILRRILGTPTPLPPADAGTLPGDPKSFGGMTLRQKLADHKRNATCANCHQRIDPLGFPLEGFDPVGRTRNAYPDGVPVDTTGEFADQTTIIGADGLLEYLAVKETLVMKTLAKKMLGYALGRTVLASDRPLIDELVAAGGNATFSDLATRIVSSRQFRYRQGRDEAARDSKSE
jgi:hypothetical protein